MASVRFEGVWKLFGDLPAVAGLDLDIDDGEFVVFVGPSGCGKTTSLRLLAGLERPSYGSIWIDNDDVTRLPPGKRDIAMVFQSYALYPNMTVERNLAFGPTVRREDKRELPSRVHQVASVLGLELLLDRKPAELSGGQRQRVALGRALIRQPRLFLMDEPLSNLDAALRVQMREELVRLHQLLSVTTVYVTHDQVEAMTMGDRVAVMNGGQLLQVGTPDELFENPGDLFVATFVGTPKMNTFSAELTSDRDGSTAIRSLGISVPVTDWQAAQLLQGRTQTPVVGLRPSDLHWEAEASPECKAHLKGVCSMIERLGAESFASVTIGDVVMKARLPRACRVNADEPIDLAFDPADLYFFDPQLGKAIVERPGAAGQKNQELQQNATAIPDIAPSRRMVNQ